MPSTRLKLHLKKFLSVFATMLISVTSLAAFQSTPAAQGVEMTFADLLKIIQSEERPTIDTTIGNLPPSHLHNYTLVHRSLSLQDSSATHPRAILFGDTASLVLTFNGDPKHRGYDTLETMEFHGNRLLFREILFKADYEEIHGESFGAYNQLSSSTQSEIGLSEDEIAYEDEHILVTTPNPAKCMVCHELRGTGLAKPIWDDYNTWPGAFGQVDDAIGRIGTDRGENTPLPLIDADEEFSLYLSYLENVESRPRYRHLYRSPKNVIFPYHIGSINSSLQISHAETLEKFGPESLDRHKYHMPNTRLTSLLTLNYAYSLARYVLSHPVYQHYHSEFREWFLCLQQPEAETLAELANLFSDPAYYGHSPPLEPFHTGSTALQLLGPESIPTMTAALAEADTVLLTGDFLALFSIPYGNPTLSLFVNPGNKNYRVPMSANFRTPFLAPYSHNQFNSMTSKFANTLVRLLMEEDPKLKPLADRIYRKGLRGVQDPQRRDEGHYVYMETRTLPYSNTLFEDFGPELKEYCQNAYKAESSTATGVVESVELSSPNSPLEPSPQQ